MGQVTLTAEDLGTAIRAAAETAALEQEIRNAAWGRVSVPFNPSAAFPAYARANGLGNPVTGEFDKTVAGVTYRIQGFSRAVVWCVVGQWDKVRHMPW